MEPVESTGEQVDVEKLVELVEARPILYDIDQKEHHNVDIIHQLWVEISKELNTPVHVCKGKWHSLRSSFARHLREAGRGAKSANFKRKKWYLADAMSFLLKYSGSRKNVTSTSVSDNVPTTSNIDNSNMTSFSDIDIADFSDTDNNQEMDIHEDFKPGIYELQFKSQEFLSDNARSANDAEEMCRIKNVSPKVVSESVVSYSNSTTNVNSKTSEDQMFHFFKSIISDINMLNMKKQRHFKTGVLQLIDNLLDEQEREEMTSPQPPKVAPQPKPYGVVKNTGDGSSASNKSSGSEYDGDDRVSIGEGWSVTTASAHVMSRTRQTNEWAGAILRGAFGDDAMKYRCRPRKEDLLRFPQSFLTAAKYHYEKFLRRLGYKDPALTSQLRVMGSMLADRATDMEGHRGKRKRPSYVEEKEEDEDYASQQLLSTGMQHVSTIIKSRKWAIKKPCLKLRILKCEKFVDNVHFK